MARTGGRTCAVVDEPVSGKPGEPYPGPAAAADPEAVLAALDPEQRQVALATPGPVCVLAGAGTGKTRAVAHRIAYAALTGVVDPAHVLAVTFTTRAAGELRGPAAPAGRAGRRAWSGSRPAPSTRPRCASSSTSGRPPWAAGPAAVLDSKVSLLAEAARRPAGVAPGCRGAARRRGRDRVGQGRPRSGRTTTPGRRRRRAAPRRSPPTSGPAVRRLRGSAPRPAPGGLRVRARAHRRHPRRAPAGRRRGHGTGTATSWSMSTRTSTRCRSCCWTAGPGIATTCAWSATRGRPSTRSPGPPPAYLTGFAAEFPDATVVELVRNYRSTPQIIALANQLTGAAGPRSLADQLRAGAGWADRRARRSGPAARRRWSPSGPRARRPSSPSTRTRRPRRRRWPRGWPRCRAEGVPPGQIAVLVRTNAQTLALEQALAERGVPCQVRGAERFFDRPEVRQATGLLRAAAKSVSVRGQRDPPAEVRHDPGRAGPHPRAPAGPRRRPGALGVAGGAGPAGRGLFRRPSGRRAWAPSSASWPAAAPSGTPRPSRASPWPRCTRPRGWSGTWSSCPA